MVSNVKDVPYSKNIFNEDVNQDNLLNVLAYSDDLINNYRDMPYFQIDKIEEFNKRDLFIRYALDNLAGLMIGTKKGNRLYDKYIVDKNTLNKRIEQVRGNSKKPEFGKMV